APNFKFQTYLHTPVGRSRAAIVQLLASTHELAVERLRRRVNGVEVPRHERLCRFCHVGVEDEAHAITACSANPSVVDARRMFIMRMSKIHLLFTHTLVGKHGTEFIIACLQQPKATTEFGLMVAKIFRLYEATPLYRQTVGPMQDKEEHAESQQESGSECEDVDYLWDSWDEDW
ncbi:hypothetical protein DL96DRAFT_1481351, partial [Flagelloscypha sp. PMI_526]